MHPFGHRNISVRRILIYLKTEGVIKFSLVQNWPTGVLTPNIVVYTILSNAYFHQVALSICRVVNMQAKNHSE